MPALDFWYDFASTYSYPAAMRIADAARSKGVSVRWRPFLLGPIFAAQGWTTSPFNLYPAKGQNMWRDLERLCEKARLPFVRPKIFPQNSLLAARIACVLEDAPRADLSRAVYAHEFGGGGDIDKPETMAALLERCGIDARATLERAGSADTKAQLKAQTTQAVEHGIFGAPSFVTSGGELFWGFDRLDDAIAWAALE